MVTHQKSNVFSQISIAARIIDGSIKIDSRAEFENILRLFPNDPALLRIYADLLVTKKSPEIAAKSYGEAAHLFIDSGRTLQAIVSKSLARTRKSYIKNLAFIYLKMISLGIFTLLKINSCLSPMLRPSQKPNLLRYPK